MEDPIGDAWQFATDTEDLDSDKTDFDRFSSDSETEDEADNPPLSHRGGTRVGCAI